MALLQPRLNLKVAQKQVLTPGLVQMVSLLALNKQELKEMIDAEILENPVLEELDETVPSIDDVRTPEEAQPSAEAKAEEKDPFDEIDFGSYFQDYLDPGYRTPNSTEISERPSFENFLSKPTTLTDHLLWQLGSLHLSPAVREAAELVIGNLDESGYLTATDEELLAALARENPVNAPDPEPDGVDCRMFSVDEKLFPSDVMSAGSLNLNDIAAQNGHLHSANGHSNGSVSMPGSWYNNGNSHINGTAKTHSHLHPIQDFNGEGSASSPAFSKGARHSNGVGNPEIRKVAQYPAALQQQLAEGLQVVRRLDPIGIAARDLRECLLFQLDARIQEAAEISASRLQLCASATNAGSPGLDSEDNTESLIGNQVAMENTGAVSLARRIIDGFLPYLLKRDIRELSRLTGSQQTQVQAAIETIRGLDPKPGQRYNRVEVRLVEPDVAFVKRDGEYVILLNDEELPTLRLNHGYRRMLSQDGTERDVKDYVKERYRSAIQLMRNIEQRKNTILRTCEVIVRRQLDFLEQGVDALKPMMIKEVAEEIGVHASTVSRAVANKYVHTPQGVFELRFFFTEGVNGPEGADTPLLLLKRKVKKLIEEEDARKPLTDDAIATLLQGHGIAVNRRTVAKYREDMGIPSTHQRRVRI